MFHIEQLQNVLHADQLPDGFRLVAAGPLAKQPATMAYRVVLVANDSQFIVYDQQFPKFPQLDKSNYITGNYYRIDELQQATTRFASRVAQQAQFLQSLYRDLVKPGTY